MRMPRQVPPVRRDATPRAPEGRARRAARGDGVMAAGTTVLRLSEIANDHSILMDTGEALLGSDPAIHFDIEPPEAPIEMCDVYCVDTRGPADGGRKAVHGHIYGDIPGGGNAGPSAHGDPVSPHVGMCDVYCMDARERVIHGHIYGSWTPHE